jgi:hypothetical protein
MIEVKQATLADLVTVSSILKEAADWLRMTGRAMWRDDELDPDRIHQDVAAGYSISPIMTGNLPEPSSSNWKTHVSGRTSQRTMLLTCIESPYDANSLAKVFQAGCWSGQSATPPL